jgi:hypothetical protein
MFVRPDNHIASLPSGKSRGDGGVVGFSRTCYRRGKVEADASPETAATSGRPSLVAPRAIASQQSIAIALPIFLLGFEMKFENVYWDVGSMEID